MVSLVYDSASESLAATAVANRRATVHVIVDTLSDPCTMWRGVADCAKIMCALRPRQALRRLSVLSVAVAHTGSCQADIAASCHLQPCYSCMDINVCLREVVN
jgi:hypothetical protein